MSQTGRSRPDASAARDVRRRLLALAVDIVALTVREGALRVLLIRRSSPHHGGEWALPGGFVGVEEPLDAAAERELLGDTGVHLDPTHLEQLRAYGDPDRDDRAGKRVVTVAYLAIQPDLPEPVAGEDASAARWEPVGNVLSGAQPLAFDHSVIVGDAVHRVREELEHTALATAFCPQEFTEAQLRAVYEAVWRSAGMTPSGAWTRPISIARSRPCTRPSCSACPRSGRPPGGGRRRCTARATSSASVAPPRAWSGRCCARAAARWSGGSTEGGGHAAPAGMRPVHQPVPPGLSGDYSG